MQLTAERLTSLRHRLPASSGPVALVILVVLLGNVIYVTGLGNINPLTWTSGLTHILCHVTCGREAIDPNVGFVTTAIGHRAALDLLSGHLPWWNYLQGLGQPLVGEMQSAAFFPLTLLFATPLSLLWFHMILEMTAGVSTYFLARRFTSPTFVAIVAGALFALNGTYAWIGNSVMNPIAFLPMLILGLERIIDVAESPRRHGWYLAALALALSLYSGFPEVAYLDGLFCVGWALVRLFSLPKEHRLRTVLRFATGGAVGVLLALPVLVPFVDFLKVAFVGAHGGAGEGTSQLSHLSLRMYFSPYLYGTIFENSNAGQAWGGIGGYFTISVSMLALVGLFGRTYRALRIFMAAWVVAGILGTFNFFGFHQIWDIIPLVKNAALGRYIMASSELAMILLAALALNDMVHAERVRRWLVPSSLLGLIVLLWFSHQAAPIDAGMHFPSPRTHFIFLALQSIPFVAVVLYFLLGLLKRFRWMPWLVALVVVGEAWLMFIVPTAESPKQITVDTAPVSYIVTHQGEMRFVDLAVLYPNWGSYFGASSLSALDLPFPRAFVQYIQKDLYPGLNPENQYVVKGGMTGIILMENELVAHFTNYEAASVKYIIAPTAVPLDPRLTHLGVREVYHDPYISVYQMPHPRAFFTTANANCTITSTDYSHAQVNCPAGATTLLRTELMMKGWHASVNGQDTPITTVDGVYQQIQLPPGQSSVVYTFLPPHERAAAAAFLLGLVIVALALYDQRRPLFARSSRGRHSA